MSGSGDRKRSNEDQRQVRATDGYFKNVEQAKAWYLKRHPATTGPPWWIWLVAAIPVLLLSLIR